jgi:hypothetical protein
MSAAVAAAARGEHVDDGGVRGWWERDERLRTPAELVAARVAGLPEGHHIRAAAGVPA